MITIISSTNRQNSKSILVSNYYLNLFKSLGEEAQIIDLRNLPHDFAFSALYELSGKNEAFNVFRKMMEESDKFLFVIPEYNGSFPGILKTFIDGQKFPDSIRYKKAALTGISSGTQGSALSMSHFGDVLVYLGCNVLSIKPRVINIETAFVSNDFTDPKVKDLILLQAQKLIEF